MLPLVQRSKSSELNDVMFIRQQIFSLPTNLISLSNVFN